MLPIFVTACCKTCPTENASATSALIESGVADGDMVVTQGIDKLQPGSKVEPRDASKSGKGGEGKSRRGKATSVGRKAPDGKSPEGKAPDAKPTEGKSTEGDPAAGKASTDKDAGESTPSEKTDAGSPGGDHPATVPPASGLSFGAKGKSGSFGGKRRGGKAP